MDNCKSLKSLYQGFSFNIDEWVLVRDTNGDGIINKGISANDVLFKAFGNHMVVAIKEDGVAFEDTLFTQIQSIHKRKELAA